MRSRADAAPCRLPGLALSAIIAGALAAPCPATQDDPIYDVERLDLVYSPTFQIVRDRPALEALGAVQVTLAREGEALTAPRPGLEPVLTRIDGIGAPDGARLTASALEAVGDALVAYFDERGVAGTFVAPDPQDVDAESGRDLRRGRGGPMRLMLVFDGPFLEINRFTLAYALADQKGLPPIDEVFEQVQVTFHRTEEGYVAWRPTGRVFRLYLADLREQVTIRLSLSAVQAVLQAVNDYMLAQGLMGVRVVPAAGQLRGIDDVRPDKDFRIEVVTGVVTQLRTLAAGERIAPQERLNHPAHAWIRDKSPIQPAVAGETDPRHLLDRKVLDDYLFWLSRHPGRRVDAALAPAREEHGISLDYIVAENKPLLLYAQVSNTGTAQTDRVRQRFGLFHNQLTGHDDVLAVEYVTASFDESNAVLASYEGRFLDLDRVRWRAYGSWSEYRASDVGFADEQFVGESWQGGGEIIWNVAQDRQLFVDLIGGARFADIEVENKIVQTTGEETFLIPYFGARLSRFTEEVATDATLAFHVNPDWLSADVLELNELGRLFPDEDWVVMRWDLFHSFYLEPILAAERLAAGELALAHEIALRFRGQYAFDHRLIPQEQQVAGGLYSVRGYPESISVGDDVYLFSAEYRLHVPQALGIEPEPGRDPIFRDRHFRWKPQHGFGRADWDLILRGFVDVASTNHSEGFAFERNDSLVGVGIGAELLYRQNLNVRLDWGFALEDIPGEVDSGSDRLHVVATILY